VYILTFRDGLIVRIEVFFDRAQADVAFNAPE
jgi:ketosteroid isomerase-like protein